MRTERSHLSIVAATLAVVVGTTLAGCGPLEASMTPDEARDTLTGIIHDPAGLLGAAGWQEAGAPGVESCDDGRG